MTLGDAPPERRPAPAAGPPPRARHARPGTTRPLVVDPMGRAVGIDALPLHLRKARSYQVGVEANTSICRGQLAARYGL